MSRCFPFPPPGYEKKFKAENLDLLTKEKRREKKHKKEKKDKEKKEHKEKKEKDRNKDKQKEKKDRKEKHKDRKKGKDIDKGQTPEDSTVENRTEGRNELQIQGGLQKAEEGKDAKFAEEFGRRTRDDGAANQLVGCMASSVPRKFGAGAASPLLEKERGADKKVLPAHIGSVQKNSGSVEKVPNSLPRRVENTSSPISMEKERSKIHEKITVGSTESSRNHAISRPDGISGLANRKREYSTTGMEKEKGSERNPIPNHIESPLERAQLGEKVKASSSAPTHKRNNVMGLSVDNTSFRCKPEGMVNSSIRSRMEGISAVPSIEKERFKGREMVPHPSISEQRTRTSFGPPVEMDRYPKLDGKVVSDLGEKKIKPKDAVRQSFEKEKEEKIAKAEKVEIDKPRNFWKKDQVDTLNNKPLAPHKDNTTGIRDFDVTTKKRKDFKANGFLHENDARPSKIPRLNSSSQPPVNVRTPELHPDAPFSLPLKDGSANNLKPGRTLDNNVKKINGTPSARSLLENGDVSSKLPHPDSAYLHHIYTVPKMEALSEVDDLDWLFNCRDSRQKPKTENEAENATQVWAQALRIDSADGFALPYVVPF